MTRLHWPWIFLAIMSLQMSPLAKAGGTPTSENIEIPDTGFSIIPPRNWSIQRNALGSSLIFEAPKNPGSNYQPTIQVMVFNGYRYVDDLTENEYGKIILDKFSKASNRISDYHLRSADAIQMQTGQPALLYYTEFNLDNVAMMQMHILISSDKNHFLMSYTDLAKTFEDENSPGLAIAYASMHSARVAREAPSAMVSSDRCRQHIMLLLGLLFCIRFIRSRRISQLGDEFEEENTSRRSFKKSPQDDFGDEGSSVLAIIDENDEQDSAEDFAEKDFNNKRNSAKKLEKKAIRDPYEAEDDEEDDDEFERISRPLIPIPSKSVTEVDQRSIPKPMPPPAPHSKPSSPIPTVAKPDNHETQHELSEEASLSAILPQAGSIRKANPQTRDSTGEEFQRRGRAEVLKKPAQDDLDNDDESLVVPKTLDERENFEPTDLDLDEEWANVSKKKRAKTKSKPAEDDESSDRDD